MFYKVTVLDHPNWFRQAWVIQHSDKWNYNLHLSLVKWPKNDVLWSEIHKYLPQINKLFSPFTIFLPSKALTESTIGLFVASHDFPVRIQECTPQLAKYHAGPVYNKETT